MLDPLFPPFFCISSVTLVNVYVDLLVFTRIVSTS